MASQEGELEEGGPRPGREALQPSGAGGKSGIRAPRVSNTFCLKGSECATEF